MKTITILYIFLPILMIFTAPAYGSEISNSLEVISPSTDKPSLTEKSKIPEWVRNIFMWYGQGEISEDDVLNAIKFLLENKIIQLESMNQSMDMMKSQMMNKMSINTNAPITIPMIDGYYKGNKVYFVHTEVSDSSMAERMTGMINFL
jgi:hypothetical protein